MTNLNLKEETQRQLDARVFHTKVAKQEVLDAIQNQYRVVVKENDHLTKNLDGIKVTCFFPGSISTSFFDDIESVTLHDNMMHPVDIAKTLKYVLETSDNFLINEITMRPLNPKPPAAK